MDLARKYRPKTLLALKGQPEAVRILQGYSTKKNYPHALLFTGPSGCGKTTAARIVAADLGCTNKTSLFEMNTADNRGVDDARQIKNRINTKSLLGTGKKVYLLDEFHQATKDFQTLMLKEFEEPPAHAYFFLCTTDPGKLLPTIKTRCVEIKMRLFSPDEIAELVADVAKREGLKIGKVVVDEIVECAEGSPRKSLMLLDSIKSIKSETEQLSAIVKSDTKKQAIELCRKLIAPKPNWRDVAAIIKGLEDDPESVRRMVLGYCATVCLGGGKLSPRAAAVINCFSANFFDTGRAGLVLAAYDACHN